jgi:hypothetical protein
MHISLSLPCSCANTGIITRSLSNKHTVRQEIEEGVHQGRWPFTYYYFRYKRTEPKRTQWVQSDVGWWVVTTAGSWDADSGRSDAVCHLFRVVNGVWL